MADIEELEKVREIFRWDRFATEMGAVVDEIGDHCAKCSLIINEHHKNAMGGIMGGVYFTLADFALAVVANDIHSLSVAQQVSINYLNAPKGSILYADSECIKNGRTTSTIQVKVSDDTGRDIALFIGSVFKLNA